MALEAVNFLIVEELEREEERNRMRLFRRMIRDAQDPFSISEQEFIKNFRLNKAASLDIINTLAPHMEQGTQRNRLPVVLRVLTVFHFLAVGSYQRSIGTNILSCLSQTMVSRCITGVINIINRRLLKIWIKFPRNADQRNAIKDKFFREHHMPEIVGIVDGTHVAIIMPHQNEHVFVNRKGYHSLNCQIVCDAELKILNIIARWPGSTHDAFIWRASIVAQIMRGNFENINDNSKIMGDSGYPCLPWLLVPVANINSPQEQRFNEAFKRCRSTIERCIGLLKGRFRCLLKDRVLHYSPQKAAKIIMACCVLHNIAIHYRVDNPEAQWDEIDMRQQVLPQIPAAAPDNVLRQLGQQTRRLYIQRYFA